MDPASTHDADAEATEFVRLLTLYQPNIYLYVRSLVLDPVEADEVLQDTNLVMWEKRQQFKCNTNFLAWAFQIARHKLRQHRDQAKRKRRCFSDALIDELALQSSRYSSINSNLLDELRRCLSQLAARDREIICRRYQPQATCEGIAKEIGRPVRWVYNALARIREELLDCITRSSSMNRQRDQ